MSKVWKESPLEGSRLLILLSLADMANDDGYCYPSYATLAKRARLKSRQNAINIVAEMVDAGIVEKSTRSHPDGNQTSNLYRVIAKNLPRQCTPSTTSDTTPSTTSDTTLVLPVIPESSVNRQLKHSESAQKARAVCNQSPVWAIAHGENPECLSKSEIFEKELINSLETMPQEVKSLARTYMAETLRLCAAYEQTKWIKAFRQMRQQSITPDILRETILDMRQRGITNTWPGSCLNIAAMKVARSRAEAIAQPTFEAPDYWNNTPIIPTNPLNFRGTDAG